MFGTAYWTHRPHPFKQCLVASLIEVYGENKINPPH